MDDRLWPGERPFTEFGQWGYGSLDLRVFDQDTVWCNIAGRALKVTHMDPDYRANVLAFLRDNAAYFHLMTIRRRLIELYADLADGVLEPVGADQLRDLLGRDPVEWIAATPIARALRDANASRGNLP